MPLGLLRVIVLAKILPKVNVAEDFSNAGEDAAHSHSSL